MTANPAAARLSAQLVRNYHEVRIALNRLEFHGVESEEAESLVREWAAEGRRLNEAYNEWIKERHT